MSGFQLSIDADLTLVRGDEEVRVSGVGSNVVIEVADLRSAVRILRTARALGLSKLTDTSAKALNGMGLTVTLKTPKRRLLTLGGGDGSILTKLLGFPGVSLHTR